MGIPTRWATAAALGLVLWVATVRGAAGPENVALVVNADSWASRYLAHQYAAARSIAADHLVLLRDLPSFENLPVEAFRRRILQPVLAALEARGLRGQIDYVLYSTDLPTAIDVSADVGDRKLPVIFTRQASITGLTYLYQQVDRKDPAYLDLQSNAYARRVMNPTADRPWDASERERYLRTLAQLQQWEQPPKKAAANKSAPPPDPQARRAALQEALDSLTELARSHAQAAEVHYNRACALAQLQRPDEALAALRAAVKAGWWDDQHLLHDRDLQALQARDDFRQLAAQLGAAPLPLAPTQRFSAAAGWDQHGAPAPPDAGPRYLLSTMLGYTSGRGLSVAQTWDGLRRSIAADGTRPSGTVYFLENNDIRSRTRQWGFRRAAAALRQAGVAAEVASGVLPRDKADVAGLSVGAASFAWDRCGSKILPGAICEHLTSCGGMLHERASQTPLVEFLRYGAAGASGTVAEPYAVQAKFPTPFIQLFYAQGCTLAEAFYQSLSGPYQLLIVGDALCAPWSRPAEIQVAGVRPGDKLHGRVELSAAWKSPGIRQPTRFEFYVDGRRLASTDGPYTLDTTSLPDGPHELSVAAHVPQDLAARGRWNAAVTVANGQAALRVTPAAPRTLTWDQPLAIEVALPGAQAIELWFAGERVAQVAGDHGRLEVELRKWGPGPLRLQPSGRLTNGSRVWGTALDVTVSPPPSLPGLKLPADVPLSPGLLFAAADQPGKTIDRWESDTLAKSGVRPGTSFSLDAYFQVPQDDLYQFQLRGDVKAIQIDGRRQDWPRAATWWYVPIALAAGWHTLHVTGVAGPEPLLDMRFGGSGTRRLDGTVFRHR